MPKAKAPQGPPLPLNIARAATVNAGRRAVCFYTMSSICRTDVPVRLVGPNVRARLGDIPNAQQHTDDHSSPCVTVRRAQRAHAIGLFRSHQAGGLHAPTRSEQVPCPHDVGAAKGARAITAGCQTPAPKQSLYSCQSPRSMSSLAALASLSMWLATDLAPESLSSSAGLSSKKSSRI